MNEKFSNPLNQPPEKKGLDPWMLLDVGGIEEVEKKPQLSKVEQEREAIITVRSASLKSVIEKYIPNISLEEMMECIASNDKKTVSELSEDDKGYAEQLLQSYKIDRNIIIYEIAKSNISESDFEKYFSTIYDTAKEIHSEASFKDLESLCKAAQSLEQASLYKNFTSVWKDKFVEGIDDESIKKQRLIKLKNIITDLSGYNIYPRPVRSIDEMQQLFTSYTDIYEYFQSIPPDHPNNQKIKASAESDYLKPSIAETFANGAWKDGLSLHSSDQIRKILEIFQITAESENKEALAIFANIIISYGGTHKLTEDAVKGLTEKMFPAVVKKDSQVEILIRNGNIWGMRKGDFGIADFICQSYTSPVDPEHLNELMLISREVPTTSLSRLEQNRKDALALVDTFGTLRDFIHDQQLYVHEVIEGMVDFYDTGNSSKLSAILPKVEYFNSEEQTALLLDRNNYDKKISHSTFNGEIPAINLLRRLLENTKAVVDEPPVTSDQELNQKVAEFNSAEFPSNQELFAVLNVINVKIESMMHSCEIGIEPNYILLLGWVERKCFEALRGLKYEDQMSAYKQDWFASVLKFNELTASDGKFNEQEFDKFVEEVQGSKSFEAAYKLIGKRILGQTFNLVKKYKEKDRGDTGVLWSGNITHELIALIDSREPTTEQGRKAILENQWRRIEPSYHPGD